MTSALSRTLRPLVAATLALALGIVLALRTAPPTPLPILLLACAATLALTTTEREPVLIAAFAAVGMLLGQNAGEAARAACTAFVPEGVPLELRGAFAAHPADDAVRPSAGGVGRFRLESISNRTAEISCTGVVHVRIRERAGTAPPPGTPVTVRGTWRSWPVEGPWPRPADRLGTLTIDSIGVPSSPTGSPSIARVADRLRGGAQARIRAIHGERAPIVEALLLAQRDGFDPEVRDRYVRAGLAHLLAISGLHVGLITAALLLLGRILRLSSRTSAWLAAALTVVYVLMLGAPYAASRAALQVVLLLASRILQRPADPLAMLASAALVILTLDPLAVLDAGFHLSFGGVAGIVLLRRRLIDVVPAGGWVGTVWEGIAISIAATVTTTPIAVLHFGQAAPIGILANLIAVPIMALAVPALAVALLASTVWLEVGRFLAGGAELLLIALDATARVAAAVPAGNALVPRDSVIAWALAAALAAWMSHHLARKQDRVRAVVRRSAATLAAVAVLIAWPVVASGTRAGTLEIHGIDVGQGDALAVRTPAGRWILVDAGLRSPGYDAGRSRVLPYLLRHGVRRLEALVLTHPHSDHIGGALAILEALPVGTVIDPGVAVSSSYYLDVVRAAHHDDTRWIAARPEMETVIDNVVIRFLHPPEGQYGAELDANEVSVVFALEYGAFRALFLGDAYSDAEAEMVERYGERMSADVLKVGHHGSRTSTSEALLRAAGPRVALVSAGRDNRYGHPHRRVIERLERHGVEIYRTDRHGSIRIRVRADRELDVRATR